MNESNRINVAHQQGDHHGFGYSYAHNMDLDLGYGEETSIPSMIDLGYGKQVHIPKSYPCRLSSRLVQNVKAVQKKQPRQRKSIFADSLSEDGDSDSDDPYDDDSSVDYSDCSEDSDGFSLPVTEITCESDYEEGGGSRAYACAKHGITSVKIEFRGDAQEPRRVSLNFSQHADGHALNRSGRLGVSIGTTKLKRQGNIDCFNSSMDSILSVSARPMRRISMGSVTAPPNEEKLQTRRITMNLCSPRQSRCIAMGRTYSNISQRRSTMDHTCQTMPLSQRSTRRLSMECSTASKDSQPRRISMNLGKSVFSRHRPEAQRFFSKIRGESKSMMKPLPASEPEGDVASTKALPTVARTA
jgi:hypothetical protein